LDTNVISDYINGVTHLQLAIETARENGNTLYLCDPVEFEVVRGLIHTNATRKRAVFEEKVKPLLEPLSLNEADWTQAARFWADGVRIGKKLSDVDLLLAALAVRVGAIIISADTDFDALPVTRLYWRA